MVSIILPNYNYRNYLPIRLRSIVNQTHEDWECIIIDGFSDDGSWELIKTLTANDQRFRLFQENRRGIYDAINKGIERATGEYIYIATSDDIMADVFLSVMIDALTVHSDCGIAHCCLTIIDEYGNSIPGFRWESFLPYTFYNDLMKKQHKRLAPLDGLLYSTLTTIYFSLNQLLIDKNVFENTGLFRTDYGPQGDFEWGMKAGLVTNTIHVPDYLASWRYHPMQATRIDAYKDIQYRKSLNMMVLSAFRFYKSHGNLKKISKGDIFAPYLLEVFRLEYNSRLGRTGKVLVMLKYLLKHFVLAKYIVAEVYFRRRFSNIAHAKFLMKKYKLRNNIVYDS
jgi:glycosyltransferase involved in cell wall biosynthesis